MASFTDLRSVIGCQAGAMISTGSLSFLLSTLLHRLWIKRAILALFIVHITLDFASNE